MCFAVYFLVFALFICTCNLEQVFGEYKVSLNAYNCFKEDIFCGVQVRAMKSTEKNQIPEVTLRTVTVLRELIQDEKTPDSKRESKPANVPPTWSGECLRKFCVAVLKDSNSPPIFKMSHPNPMIDISNFYMFGPGNPKDPILATTIPILPLIPRFNYSCDHDRKECIISSSAYGAGPFHYTIPYDVNDGELTDFTTTHYANGVAVCFQAYCTFSDTYNFYTRANFDKNHYDNIVPLPLKPNENYEISHDSLIDSAIETQVMITREKGVNKIRQLKCTYDLPAKRNKIPVGPLTAFINIPKYVKNSDLLPILRFKAKNGVGVCAGYACCFKAVGENDKLYKNKANVHRYHPRYSWAKTVKHTDDLDLETAY